MSASPEPRPLGKSRVVYVTVVSVGTIESGGSIVCRQHIERLHSLPSVELTVCLIGTREANLQGERYLANLGIPSVSFQLGHGKLSPLFPLGQWPFMFEKVALRSRSINKDFRTFCDAVDADVFVLDYLFTALFIPSLFELSRRIVVITLNPEADFYETLRRLGRLHETCSRSAMAVRRLRAFENWVYRQATAVVALSPNDVPTDRKVSSAVIRPAIEAKFLGWQYAGRKDICFVGNIAHFPNWLAVRWLCEQFAPALARRDDKVRVQIVGADAKDVPEDWRKSNVDFLGTATDVVQERMLTCGLFIAPIENNYGSKIKILECLAYGTPLLATPEALSGLEDLSGLPLIALSDPAGAADAACRLLADLEALVTLSACENQILATLSAHSTEGWRQLIARVMASPPRKAVPRILNFPVFLWGSLLNYRGRGKGEKVNLAKSNAPDLALEGFQESTTIEGRPIRWTTGTARIRIKGRGRLPRKLRLECWNLPEGGPARVDVKVNGDIALTMQDPGSRGSQTVRLPHRSDRDGMVIEIEGETADDLRQRGVPLRRLQVVW